MADDDKTPEVEVLPAKAFAVEPGHAGKPRQELTLREAREVAARQVDDKLRREAEAIVQAVAAAADIDDDGVVTDDDGKVVARVPPENPGLPARAFRIARDARRPNKDAPVYLAMMAKVHAGYVAADAQKGGEAQPLNVTFATRVNVTYQYGAEDYPVKEIKDDE